VVSGDSVVQRARAARSVMLKSKGVQQNSGQTADGCDPLPHVPIELDDAEANTGVHPWKSTTLFRLRWWWQGAPQVLRRAGAAPITSILDTWESWTHKARDQRAAATSDELGASEELRALPAQWCSEFCSGAGARGIGQYNFKFLFSDESLAGCLDLGNTYLHTPVGPTGAMSGLWLVVPDIQKKRLDLPAREASVRAIQHLTILANKLILDDSLPSNALRRGTENLLARNGGGIVIRSLSEHHPITSARGQYALHLYDVQVALCEYSRWLRGGGSANRPAPADAWKRSQEHATARSRV
jgi:hypothetical protein